MFNSEHKIKMIRKELDNARTIINEKDSELLRLKEQLSERSVSAIVEEESSEVSKRINAQ